MIEIPEGDIHIVPFIGHYRGLDWLCAEFKAGSEDPVVFCYGIYADDDDEECVCIDDFGVYASVGKLQLWAPWHHAGMSGAIWSNWFHVTMSDKLVIYRVMRVEAGEDVFVRSYYVPTPMLKTVLDRLFWSFLLLPRNYLKYKWGNFQHTKKLWSIFYTRWTIEATIDGLEFSFEWRNESFTQRVYAEHFGFIFPARKVVPEIWTEDGVTLVDFGNKAMSIVHKPKSYTVVAVENPGHGVDYHIRSYEGIYTDKGIHTTAAAYQAKHVFTSAWYVAKLCGELEKHRIGRFVFWPADKSTSEYENEYQIIRPMESDEVQQHNDFGALKGSGEFDDDKFIAYTKVVLEKPGHGVIELQPGKYRLYTYNYTYDPVLARATTD